MLLPDNIKPENTIYYNGAIVLKALQSNSKQSLIDLYINVKQQRSMSFPIYILSLDWLFIIGVAIINNKGEVTLCS